MNALLLLAVLASNPDLDKAEAQFEALKFPEAEKSLGRALSTPGNDRATILRIYELRGVLDATTGKRSAVDQFGRMLAIDPQRALSKDLGPRVLAPFYEARGRLGDAPSIKFEVLATPGPAEQSLGLRSTHDGLRMSKKAKLFWRVAGAAEWQSAEVPVAEEDASMDQKVAGAAVEYHAVLLNEFDGVLAEVGTAESPAKVSAPVVIAEKVEVQKPGRPLVINTGRKAAIVAVAVGGACLLGGLISGIISSSARDAVNNPKRDADGRPIELTPAKIHELEQRTTGAAVASNILWVTGGVLIAGGVVLFIIGPGGDGPTVAVAPAPGGAVIAGQF